MSRVEHWLDIYPNKFQHLTEGTEVARLRLPLPFILQDALSFRSRHHLCRQGVALAGTRELRSQGPVSVHAHCTEGVTRWEETNEVGDGNGDGGGNKRTNARRRERERVQYGRRERGRERKREQKQERDRRRERK